MQEQFYIHTRTSFSVLVSRALVASSNSSSLGAFRKALQEGGQRGESRGENISL